MHSRHFYFVPNMTNIFVSIVFWVEGEIEKVENSSSRSERKWKAANEIDSNEEFGNFS